MIVVSNNVAQTIAPGRSAQLPIKIFQKNTCCCNKGSNSSVKLCQKGTYFVHFNGNVGGAAGTQANLSIAVSGEVRPETTMVESITAATNVFNVAAGTLIENCCCDMDRITVVNTGTTDLILAANPALTVFKIQ